MSGNLQAQMDQQNKKLPLQVVTASAAIPKPKGLIAMGGSGAITITVAAPSADQDGDECIFLTDSAHAHVVSFTGATLLSVGVAKTTSTSGGLVGEFLRAVARSGFWIVEASAGQTFA